MIVSGPGNRRRRVEGRRRAIAVVLAVVLIALVPSGASINHRDSTIGPLATTATLTLNVPAGVAAGDVLVAAIAYDDGNAIAVTPDQAGWAHATGTDVQNAKKVGLAVYTRAATASEPASYSWTLSPASFATGAILAYQGVVAPPLDGTSTAFGKSTSLDVTAPTTTVANTMLVGVWAADASDSITPPTQMTQRQSGAASGGGASQVAFAVADEPQPAVGSPGTRSATLPGPATSDYVAVMMALKPPSISFAQATSTAAEGDGTASIGVSLSSVVTADVTVDYAATDVTTSGSSDYTLGTGTLTIPAGSSTGTISINLVDDAKGENPEDVEVTLSNPTGAYLGATTTHTLTITDADPHILTFAEPFDVDGNALAAGSPWGGWAADPGASNVDSLNYVKVVNNGPDANQQFLLSFSDTSLVANDDPTAKIGINGNIRFAVWEDTSPGTTAPSEGTFALGAVASDGSVQTQFTGLDQVVWIQYRLDLLPPVLPDDSYRVSYTINPVP